MSSQTFTTLFYGAIVNQILNQVQDPVKTTQILNDFGISIGQKLVDDFLSRHPQQCQTFQEVAQGVTNAIIYFLDLKREQVQLKSKDDSQFIIEILNNPLEQFVKVPQQLQGLVYLQVLPGAVIGALRQLEYDVEILPQVHAQELANLLQNQPISSFQQIIIQYINKHSKFDQNQFINQIVFVINSKLDIYQLLIEIGCTWANMYDIYHLLYHSSVDKQELLNNVKNSDIIKKQTDNIAFYYVYYHLLFDYDKEQLKQEPNHVNFNINVIKYIFLSVCDQDIKIQELYVNQSTFVIQMIDIIQPDNPWQLCLNFIQNITIVQQLLKQYEYDQLPINAICQHYISQFDKIEIDSGKLITCLNTENNEWQGVANFLQLYMEKHFDQLYEEYQSYNESMLRRFLSLDSKIYNFIIKHSSQSLGDKLCKMDLYKYYQSKGVSHTTQLMKQHINIQDQSGTQIENLVLIFSHIFHSSSNELQLVQLQFNNDYQLLLQYKDNQFIFQENQNKFLLQEVQFNKIHNFCLQLVKINEANDYIILIYNGEQMILKTQIKNMAGNILHTANLNITSKNNVLISKSYCSYISIQLLIKILNRQYIPILQPTFDVFVANLFVASGCAENDGLILKAQYSENITLQLQKRQNMNCLLYSQLQQQKQNESITLSSKNYKSQLHGSNQFIIDRFNYKLGINDDIQKMINYYSLQELKTINYVIIKGSQSIQGYRINHSVSQLQQQVQIDDTIGDNQPKAQYTVEEFMQLYATIAQLDDISKLILLKEDCCHLFPSCVFKIQQFNEQQLDQFVLILLMSGQDLSANIILLQQLMAQLIYNKINGVVIDNELHCAFMIVMLILKKEGDETKQYRYHQLISKIQQQNSNDVLNTILYYLSFFQFSDVSEANVTKVLQIINSMLSSAKSVNLIAQFIKYYADNWIHNINTCLQRKISIYVDNVLTFYSIMTYYITETNTYDEYFLDLINKCCSYQFQSKSLNEAFSTFNLQKQFNILNVNVDKFSYSIMKIMERIIASNDIDFTIRVFEIYFKQFKYQQLENFSDSILRSYTSASFVFMQILCYMLNQQIGNIYTHLQNIQIDKLSKEDTQKINSYLEKHMFSLGTKNLCLQVFYFRKVLDQKQQQNQTNKLIDNLITGLIIQQDEMCKQEIQQYESYFQEQQEEVNLDMSTKVKLQQFLHVKKNIKEIMQAIQVIYMQKQLSINIMQYFIIPLKKQFSQIIYQYVEMNQQQQAVQLLSKHKYEQFIQIIDSQNIESFAQTYQQNVENLSTQYPESITSNVEPKERIFNIPTFIQEYQHFKNMLQSNSAIINQIQQNTMNILRSNQEITQRLVSDPELIDQIQYSKLLERVVQERKQYYSQILIPKSLYQHNDVQKLGEQVIYCTELLESEQYIMSLKVKRFYKQNINGELGILVVFANTLFYLSNAGFVDDECKNFSDTEHIQFYYMYKINFQKSKISGKLQHQNQTLMYKSKYLNYFYNARIRLSEATQILQIPRNNIYNVISHVYFHRYAGFEVILRNAYILNFSVYDQYTNMQYTKKSSSIQYQYLSAELARGLFFYVLKKQFNITAYASFITLPKIFTSKMFERQFYSISRQFIIDPEIIDIQELKKLLQQNINQPVAKYARAYSKYLLKLYQYHKVIKIYHRGQVSFELFEPQMVQIVTGQENGLDSKNKRIQACNQLCMLYIFNLIPTQMFILYINILSSRVPNHLQQTSIFPIVKNRDLKYPVQAQNTDRRNILVEKINEHDIPTVQTVKQLLNQQFFQNGTFTSNSANTLYYMFRVQPYTTALIDLQSNKFDYPDRMFHSYDCLYQQIFSNNTKEHIHQFYYSIKLFLNLFNYELEQLNNGFQLGDFYLQHLGSVGNQSPISILPSIQNYQSDNFSAGSQRHESNCTPILTENLVDELSSDDQPILLQKPSFDIRVLTSTEEEIPQNYFSLQCEFNRYLENADKEEIILWTQLFFGNLVQNPEICNQYNSTVYYLTATKESNLLGELDKLEYFGALNQPLCVQFKQVYQSLYQLEYQYMPQKSLYNNFVEGNMYLFYSFENKENNIVFYIYNGLFMYKNLYDDLIKMSKGQYVQPQYKILKDANQFQEQLVKTNTLQDNCYFKTYRNEICIYNQNNKEIGIFYHSNVITKCYGIRYNNHILMMSNDAIYILAVNIIEQHLAFVNIEYQLNVPQLISHIYNHKNAILTFILKLQDYLYYYQFDTINQQILYVSQIGISYKHYINIYQLRSNYTIIQSDERILVLTNENIIISDMDIQLLLGIQDNLKVKCSIVDDFYNEYFIILYTANMIYVLGYDHNENTCQSVVPNTQQQKLQYTSVSQNPNDYYHYQPIYEVINDNKLSNNIIQMKLERYENFKLTIKHQFRSIKPIEKIWTDQHLQYLNNGSNVQFRMIYVQFIGNECQTIQLQKQ